MAGFDIHQHLWPPGFVAALRARTSTPRLESDLLCCSEGDYAIEVAAHDLGRRLELMDRSGIDTAVVSLQPTLGIAQLGPGERDGLVAIWEDDVLELAAAAPGRIVPLAVDRPRAGFAGVSVGADRFDDLDALAPTLESLRGSGFLFVHPVAGSSPLGLPAWWQAAVDYTSQMQRAYLSWLAHGQERWPDVRIVFAILAGGAPIQLERLTSRGFDVRSLLHRNLFFDTASYGRRALELSIQTYGVEQHVFGSDAPVVDPDHAVGALEGFGASVARLVREDNVARLFDRQAGGGF